MVPDSLKSDIQTFRNKNTELPIRWSHIENLHITLVPPWYTDNIGEFTGKLLTRSLPGAFTLILDTVRFGPNPDRPRLLWVTGMPSKEIKTVKSVLEKNLTFKPKYQAFVPHITLGRFRPPIDRNISRQFPVDVDWHIFVDTITLFESHLSPKGARYERIAQISLTK